MLGRRDVFARRAWFRARCCARVATVGARTAAEPRFQVAAYTDAVDADIREARRLGVSGMPFFVLNHAYGVSGAQPVHTFLHALRTAHGAVGSATG